MRTGEGDRHIGTKEEHIHGHCQADAMQNAGADVFSSDAIASAAALRIALRSTAAAASSKSPASLSRPNKAQQPGIDELTGQVLKPAVLG
jgi:hypothetical protein